MPETGIEPVRPLFRKAADFKSAVSTYFTTRASEGAILSEIGHHTTYHLACLEAIKNLGNLLWSAGCGGYGFQFA